MAAIPRIGIPVRLSNPEGADARVGKAHRMFSAIVDLVRDVEAEPVPLGGPADNGQLQATVKGLDGVLLPGGGDLNPRLYGQEPVETCYDVNPKQDELDLAVARAALGSDVPLLGICRGHQLVNVLYGGTLIQDIPQSSVVHRSPPPGSPAAGMQATKDTWAWHDVELSAGSRMAGLYKRRLDSGLTVTVASGHHQAVDDVGPGLVVTAVADDGTVEALEDPERWVVTMQWHPEAAQPSAAQRVEPFAAFVDACRERM
ncbi:gamma-glutamyl-gamma-aminobutyrate hydrolase family protein [Arthrobacter sp. M4]|uniref:gamma-glutamyl-gamma-aminobutyrate hydrolase family protein n=1 Tax=Arthrobacter sp. M4 TaxID=218160 RepID=UPI001CDC3FFE|nr:type 1 glutamine amidotransferase [Arthrobacter sp. M4]MCA4133861.1 type 1 glutamine amidotransferase [Arthrobacter sp. M4]